MRARLRQSQESVAVVIGRLRKDGTGAPQTAHWRRLDYLVALLVGLVGGGASVVILQQTQILFLYQNFAPEVVYAACGVGFGHPGEIPASLHDFLLARAPEFDCAVLQDAPPLQPVGLFTRLQLYLSYALIALWGPPTLRHVDLWPLVGLLGGAYAAGGFALFRLFFERNAALLGGVLIALSPLALTLLISFRDYSKAPFFVWGVVFLICAIRTHRPSHTCGWATLAGLAVGVGIGFRLDLLVLLIAGCISLLTVTNWRHFPNPLCNAPSADFLRDTSKASSHGRPNWRRPGAASSSNPFHFLRSSKRRISGSGPETS